MTRDYARFITAAVVVVVCGFGIHMTDAAGQAAAQPVGSKDLAVMQYAEAWSKTTEAEILEALKACWTPETTYTDTSTDTARGSMELANVILNFHKTFLGGTITTSRLDVHHNFGRFSWQLRWPVTGRPAQERDGFAFVEFNDDGTRILKMVAFFGPFPM